MEVEKFFIKQNSTAVIKCPYCQIAKTISVKRLNDPKKVVKIKCLCGKVFNATLELRKMYRKETELKGTYVNQSRDNDEGGMVVSNITMSGVGFHTLGAHKIGRDDILKIEFRLDDRQKTLIARDAVVRVIQGNYAGVEFIKVDEYDRYLDYYLTP